MADASPIIYLRVQDGVAVEAWTAPAGKTPADCFPADLAATFHAAGKALVGWTWSGSAFAPPTDHVPSLDQLRVALAAAASSACDGIANQIIPDATHQNAYTNAATIVWASGGAPSAEPAKTVFAQQGASVGIADPDVFAKVVTGVSLGSMQLATILGTLKGAADKAGSAADLATALTAFETALAAFVKGLNGSGLTVAVTAPPAISIPGING